MVWYVHEVFESKMSLIETGFFKNIKRIGQTSFTKIYNSLRRNHISISFDPKRKML